MLEPSRPAGTGRDAARIGVRALARLLAILFLLAPLGLSAAVIHFIDGDSDTSAQPQAAALSLVLPAESQGKALVLVQFSGPIQPGMLEACKKAGLEIIHYMPDYAYVATGPATALDALKTSRGVAWVGAFPAAHKVHPTLRASTAQSLDVTILGAGPLTANFIRGHSVRVRSTRMTPMGWQDTRATIPASELDAVSRVWNVFHIEPQPRYHRMDERAAQTAAGNYLPGAAAPTGPGYAAWLASKGLTGGSGIIFQIQDDGLDQGIATNAPGTAHPDILGRIVGIFNATSDPLGNTTEGHGQINAGIIMGNATVGTTDSSGFRLGQGLAPMASVYATKIFSNDGPFDTGNFTLTDLAVPAQTAGAVVSSNSWGSDAAGAYNSDAALFDALVRDANGNVPGNQPMIYFFSAGNAGSRNMTLGSPGTAKNVITIGAGENSDADGTDGCGVDPSGANNIRDIINFSSRGPTIDGRFGVSLIAVGTHVQGPVSTDPGYNGLGVCDKFWPVGQTNYARSSGTSHSTPVAAGSSLVVYEFFRDQLSEMGQGHPANPSPALIRAVMTNTATDMAGGDDGAGGTLTHVPNPQQGWGSVNLSNLIDAKNALFSHDQQTLFTASGQSFEVTITPVESGKPLKITLAWTDAPGIPASSISLVNDLDLVVTGGGNTYLGNVFSNGFSITGGTPDRVNNIEAVYIEHPAASYTVTVNAFNIAGDGVPGNATPLDQDFALFSSNGTNQSNAGIININKPFVACSDSVRVLVSDMNLRGTGTTSATLTSSSGDSEMLTLAETVLGTGVFTADLTIAAGAPAADGILQVTPGDTITATYQDADIGNGTPGIATSTATVDCTPPVISNVSITGVQIDGFTVHFTTDEPTTAEVPGGSTCGASDFTQSSPLTTDHSIVFTGLNECSAYYLRVKATDRAGNVTTDDNGGICYRAITFDSSGVIAESFEMGVDGWTGDGLWHIVDNSSAFPQSNSPTHAWWFGFEATGDYADPSGAPTRGRLRSPLFPLPSGRAASLTFFSWDDVEDTPGFDTRKVYVDNGNGVTPIFESNLNGRAWKKVGPLDLGAFAGQVVSLVFEFDSVDGVENNSRGWYVDDIAVQTSVPCLDDLGVLRADKSVYRCGEVMQLQIGDLNVAAGPLDLHITTIAGDSEHILLNDTAGDKIFRGSLPISSIAGGVVAEDGVLQGSARDTITIMYKDIDVGDGSPQDVSFTVGLDCQPPAIRDVDVVNEGTDRFTVTFKTDEPTKALGFADTVCRGSSIQSSSSIGTVHSITFEKLTPCTPYYFRIEATDLAGNLGVNENGGECFRANTLQKTVQFSDDFEPDAQIGWSSSAAVGANNWAVRVQGAAHSPTHVYSYTPGTPAIADARLVTPQILGGGELTFWHSFSFEETFDGGVLEVSTDNGVHWSDLDPFITQGGYTGTISTQFHSPIAGQPAWTGNSPAAMMQVHVDLRSFSGALLVGFRFASDESVTVENGGWFIDDVEVTIPTTCINDAGIIHSDSNSYFCGSTIRLQVLDLNAPAAPIPVTVTTSAGDSETVVLTDPDSDHIFTGTLQVDVGDQSIVPGDGKLQGDSFDTITATYQDMNTGAGGTATATEVALLNCPRTSPAPPVIADPGDIIIGNLEPSPSLPAPNPFVFPDAINLNEVVSSLLTPDSQIKWSFTGGNGRILINGLGPLDPSLEGDDDPTNPRAANRLDQNDLDPAQQDANAYTISFRNSVLSPIGGATIPQVDSGILPAQTTDLTLFASDGTLVGQRVIRVFTANNLPDSISGGRFDPVKSEDFTVVGQSTGWIGAPLPGFGGSTSVGASGLCMIVPGPGDNFVIWVSPERYFDLIDGAVYRLRVNVTTDQTAADAIPLWDFTYDNFNSSGPGNNYGGFSWVLDVDGGAQGIGRPNGRNKYEFWFAPNAVATPQWSAGAFTPQADPYNDPRLQFRVLDANPVLLTQNDSGVICILSLDIAKIQHDSLEVAATIFTSPINNGSHFVGAVGELPDNGTAFIDDFARTANITLGTIGDRRITLGYFNPLADGVEGGQFGPLELYPVVWEGNTLYRMRMVVRAAFNESDPVDSVFTAIDVTNSELGTESYTTRSGGSVMNFAASPKLAAATYEGYFFGQNTTSSLTPNANRLRPIPFFFNTPALFGDGTGGDALVIERLELDKLVTPQ